MSSNGATTEALAVAVATGAPVLLWGAPGTGKTSLVKGIAERWSLPCEVVVASIHDPTDFAGLPLVESGAVSLAPPRWAQRLVDRGTGLLFLDELTTAPPAVQAALLRVVLERTVGDLALPPEVRVVAAANPPDQAADGWDLALPLANRFCHLDWEVGVDGFVAGLTGGWSVPDVPVLPPGWERELPAARGALAGFIQARPALLLDVPDGSGAGPAWPSPRSWELAVTLLAAGRAAGVGPEATAALVSGCVGAGPAVEFFAFLEEGDLPDPESLLADPASVRLPERGDRALAVLAAVAGSVAGDPTPERWSAAWEIVGLAACTLPDVAATAARALVRCRPAGAGTPDAVTALAPVLAEAGLLGSRS